MLQYFAIEQFLYRLAVVACKANRLGLQTRACVGQRSVRIRQPVGQHAVRMAHGPCQHHVERQSLYHSHRQRRIGNIKPLFTAHQSAPPSSSPAPSGATPRRAAALARASPAGRRPAAGRLTHRARPDGQDGCLGTGNWRGREGGPHLRDEKPVTSSMAHSHGRCVAASPGSLVPPCCARVCQRCAGRSSSTGGGIRLISMRRFWARPSGLVFGTSGR